MKRVQVNSRTSTTHVSLTYPTLDANKRYTLTVEKLMVPALDSLILNKTLFTVERRLVTGTPITDANKTLNLAEDFVTFTPQNVRTVSQLVYQMNTFFREMLQRVVTSNPNLQYVAASHQYAIPADFAHQNVDWFTGLVNPEPIETAVQIIFRPDGKLGFRFSVAGLKLFVLKLTAEGKRIFARTQRYIALDAAATFDSEYETDHPILGLSAVQNLPANIVESYILVVDDSLFSHVNYRHELVLQSSLPLSNSVECDTDHSFYRHQLASYKFPDSNVSMEYKNIVGRELVEESQTMYSFEESLLTHNKFTLTGTELQNFNIYLVSRNYTYDEVTQKYIQTEVPYDLHEDTFYTVQFAVREVK